MELVEDGTLHRGIVSIFFKGLINNSFLLSMHQSEKV